MADKRQRNRKTIQNIRWFEVARRKALETGDPLAMQMLRWTKKYYRALILRKLPKEKALIQAIRYYEGLRHPRKLLGRPKKAR